MTTDAPAACSARAVAAPSPEAPPATSALAPSIRIGAGAYGLAASQRPVLRPAGEPVACVHLGARSAHHQGRDRPAPAGGPPPHPPTRRAALRRGAEPRVLADPEPARLGPRPHRQLRGAVAGAAGGRQGAAPGRDRALLRRDREPT